MKKELDSSWLWGILIGLVFVFLLAYWCNKAEAQSVITRKGNMFIQDTTSIKKNNPVPTDYTYVDEDGVPYKVYVIHYIIKKSPKTGKTYKKYLPQVTNQIVYENSKVKPRY